jgi:hypothetical protein
MDNYKKEVEKIIPDLPRGGIYYTKIAHDSWCNFLNGKGECNCHPETFTIDLETGKPINFTKK